MRLLSDLLYKAGAIEIRGSVNLAVMSLTADSRKVQKNGMFVAVKGTRSDGHDFIPAVIEAGCLVVVCEQLPEQTDEKVTYVVVKDASKALAIIASNFYDNPSEKLKVVGVTGTNGKTTTATLLYHLFMKMGYPCGLISTVVNKINDTAIPSTHTTPDAIQLQALFDDMVKTGCTHVFMEVSSHAVVQYRVSGVMFSGGIFTNITHDHLDYHITFENYLEAKHGFFRMLGSSAFMLVNNEDEHSVEMARDVKPKVLSFGLSQAADFKVRILEKHFGGMLLRIDDQECWTPLIGTFNAYNLLAVYATAICLGEEKIRVLTALSELQSVEGRFQYLRSNDNLTAIVDYAHTPDALVNVLNTIRDIRTGNEQVITVVGCGGDRDKTKRPEMARIASEMSDKVILTSDNPRSENPETIIDEMRKGVNPAEGRKVLAITDRREAIRTACMMAAPGDIILVAGKGHEKYQEIAGIKHPFDDLAELRNILQSPQD
jgi:UDP-N-acetylmuramoyl-L-alanyl-D-glutamate--2,6-diaminopimelate ligase